jgi:integrase
MTVRHLCNLFLDYQAAKVRNGERSPQRWRTIRYTLGGFASCVGDSKLVSQLRPMDFTQYGLTLSRQRSTPNTINTYRAIVRAMLNWARKNELLPVGLSWDTLERANTRTRRAGTEFLFTPEQISALLAVATPKMSAMICLGLNCGFGPMDIARLKWANLDLDRGRVVYPRCKTGVDRDLSLWPDTVRALRQLPVHGEYVFYTRCGTSFDPENGRGPCITAGFNRCAERAGIELPAGASFYSLRRTGATVLAQTGDVFSVQAFLGHVSLTEAATYVKQHALRGQTDKALSHLVGWLQGQAMAAHPPGNPAQIAL